MKKDIAVIGGGVAGVVASYMLHERHMVTLFEKNNYVGGHTNTIEVPTSTGLLPVDTGFIVCNTKNYPHFHKFLEKLNIPIRYADMSFGVVDENINLAYCSRDITSLFAQRRNLLNPNFYKLLIGIKRFWDAVAPDVGTQRVTKISLGEYLNEKHIDAGVVSSFIIPISAAIWSTPDSLMLNFPTSVFLNFFKNHGLLGYFNQPKWQTVVGGSYSYIKEFVNQFKGKIITNARVASIRREGEKVLVRLSDGSMTQYDSVVIATHADEAYQLLEDPSGWEEATLGEWRYLENETYLHTDSSFLPLNRRAWASWNYHRERMTEGRTAPFTITYHMNRLQGFVAEKEYCVTLNPRREIAEGAIIKKIHYTHPLFTSNSVSSQEALKMQRGEKNTWYCGSYCGFGFHEDAVKSAIHVAKHLGGEW